MRLEELVGQDHAVALLLRAVEVGRVPHAYLFDGPAGVGKRSAAIGLGLALICAEAPGRGCGRCDVCHRVLGGNHPDVRVILPATQQILVDQVQELVELGSHRPHEAPARVIVLEEADRLNRNSANSLLKTLEEPYPGTHFVLVTTAPDRLLPTILSRTQRVGFVPLRGDLLIDMAVRRGVDRTKAETAAALAGGSAGRFWELLTGEGEDTLWRVVSELRRAAGAPDMGSLFDAAMAAGDKEGKESLPQAIALLGRFYRDALAQASGASDLVLLRGHAPELEKLASASRRHAQLGPLRRALAGVLEADSALVANTNAVLAVERMLLEMRPCEREAV
jgi:DNA polymerase-3 subunit delta'